MLSSIENRIEIYSSKVTLQTDVAKVCYNFSIISGKILAVTLSTYPKKEQAQHL